MQKNLLSPIFLRFVGICLVLWSGMFQAGAAPGVKSYLVQGGKPNAEIVTAENPSRVTKYAARELQTYLKKISGAEVPILTQPGSAPVKIYVGPSTFTKALGINPDALKDGAFQITAKDNWLALVGAERDFVPVEPWGRSRNQEEQDRVNKAWDAVTGETYRNPFFTLYMHYLPEADIWEFDELGTLNAVHELLRELGVRWYAPGELGEVVPSLQTIPLPSVDKVVKPDFAVRHFAIYHVHRGQGDLGPWKLRLGSNPGGDRVGHTQYGHGIKFVLGRDEFKKAHPDFFAMTASGERETDHRGTGMPCLSSEELFQKHVKYVRSMFDHYGEKAVSIDMPDGFGSRSCVCASCKNQVNPEQGWAGSHSDYVWGYINRVAEEVYKTHPDRKVTGLAYSNYQLPPQKIEKLSPNLAVIECRWRSNLENPETRENFIKLRQEWLAKLPSQEYYIWDYYLHSRPGSAGIPAIFPRLIARDLRDLNGKSQGDLIEVANTVDAQEKGFPAFAVNHLNMYVTSRLWWDVNLDLDALLEEYYTLYYGPARDQMKAFLEFSEQNWVSMRRDAEKINKALSLLEGAQKAVEPDSVYAKRIQSITDFVEPLKNLERQLSKNREGVPDYRALQVKNVTKLNMRDKPLDGKLHPDYWPPIRVGALAGLLAKRQAPGGSFQILIEGKTLFLGIRCQEPDMANLNIPTTISGDPKILEGDFVSFLFETNSHTYYEIIVNPAGAILEFDHGKGASPNWASKVKAAVHQGERSWTVELRIPIAGEGARVLNLEGGIDGDPPRLVYPWYFNIFRQRVRGGEIDQSAYFISDNPEFRSAKDLARLWAK